jgi:hypothetical protein
VTALLKALAPYRKAVLSGLIAAGFAALSVAPGGIETKLDMWHNAATITRRAYVALNGSCGLPPASNLHGQRRRTVPVALQRF